MGRRAHLYNHPSEIPNQGCYLYVASLKGLIKIGSSKKGKCQSITPSGTPKVLWKAFISCSAKARILEKEAHDWLRNSPNVVQSTGRAVGLCRTREWYECDAATAIAAVKAIAVCAK